LIFFFFVIANSLFLSTGSPLNYSFNEKKSKAILTERKLDLLDEESLLQCFTELIAAIIDIEAAIKFHGASDAKFIIRFLMQLATVLCSRKTPKWFFF
jgi:hypothetical protein